MITYKNIPSPRPNTDMEILEKPMEWLKEFQDGWLAHYEKTGETDWSKYARPRNLLAPSGPGIDLSQSRLMLISSAGGHLKDTQDRFDENNKLGDYSLRAFPSDTEFTELDFAHTHYKHDYVKQDPQVLLPLRHLEDMQAEGLIGELAPDVLSFSGYQPNVIRIVKELMPKIVKAAKEMQVQAALLVPA